MICSYKMIIMLITMMNIYIYMSTCTRIGVSKTGASFIVPFEIAPGADRYEHRAER